MYSSLIDEVRLCMAQVQGRRLLAAEVRQTAKALKLLDAQLADITKAVPKDAVAKLQKVPLYFNPQYPGDQWHFALSRMIVACRANSTA